MTRGLHELSRWLGAVKGPMSSLTSGMRSHAQLLARLRATVPISAAGHLLGAVRTDRELVIFTDSPVWSSRLRFLRRELLDAAGIRNDRTPRPAMRVRIVPAHEPPVSPKLPKRTLSRKSAAVIRATASGLSDPGLRRALKRLARAASGSGRP